MPGLSCARPRSNAGTDWWTSVAAWNASVDSAPHCHRAHTALLALHAADVVAQCLHHRCLGARRLHVRPVEAPYIPRVEGAGHRAHGSELVADGLEVAGLEDLGVLGDGERVVLEDVPPREAQVVQASERQEVLDARAAPGRPLPTRMAPSCVTDPMGCASPRRASMMPAIAVVATAPSPGSSKASLPSAGAIWEGRCTRASSSPSARMRSARSATAGNVGPSDDPGPPAATRCRPAAPVFRRTGRCAWTRPLRDVTRVRCSARPVPPDEHDDHCGSK